MKSTRRTFLQKVSTLTLSSVPMMSFLAGCSATGLTTYQASSEEHTVRISVFDYPEFQLPDGAIQLDVESLALPIVVVRTSENSFVALSPICSHLGCTVRKDGTFFRCPCHGSTYALSGVVVRGPAEKSLRIVSSQNVFGQETADTLAPLTRPFVRGGVYDKPFVAQLFGKTALGGYMEAVWKFERVQGVTEELTFEARRFNMFLHCCYLGPCSVFC